MKNKLIFKSEEEMQKELKKEIADYKKGESRDGYVNKAEGEFTYRGVVYLIKVLRYYNHTNKFTSFGRDRVSDCHVVVEYPEETMPIIDLIPTEFECEFLYHDTLHSWNDKQTTEEQIETCHKWAKEDIDKLMDGEIGKRIDEGIKKLHEIKDKLSRKVKELEK